MLVELDLDDEFGFLILNFRVRFYFALIFVSSIYLLENRGKDGEIEEKDVVFR